MLALSSRLAWSRLSTNRSGLDVLAVMAFAITNWLGLTVAGGTWMFVGRSQNPPTAFVEAAQMLPGERTAAEFAQTYPALASIACAILIIPILSLGGAAARLGAGGRARRLAALRLIGMAGAEVVLMSTVESLVLAGIGAVFGGILWSVALPAWGLIGFLGEPIDPSEMLMPWWVATGVIAVILVLAALSTVLGLSKVRISPLGVARRESGPALKWWRVIAVIASLIAFGFVSYRIDPVDAPLFGILIVCVFMVIVVGTLNLVGPFVVQTIARPLARTKRPSRLLAMRRLIADPRAAWRNVSAIALLGLITAFTVAMPQEPSEGTNELFMIQIQDIRTGALITMAIGLVLAATSTLINQASATVDRADQTVALTRMGTPRQVFSRARLAQVVMPMLATLGISIPMGLVLSTPYITQAASIAHDLVGTITILGGIIVADILVFVAAAYACGPIEDRILKADYRPND